MNDTGALSSGKIRKAGFFWNAVYAGLNAVQTAIILFAVSRRYDVSVAGVLTIGFAIGNLAAITSRYGLRNYQVTDVYEKFRFPDYFLNRIIATAGTAVIAAGFLAIMTAGGRYSPGKSLIILEIIILRIEGAFEEVYVSRLQQKGRLDVGSRIASLRLGISTLVIFAAVWVIPNLPVCLLLGIMTGILLDILLIPPAKKYADFDLSSLRRKSAGELLKAGFPLCAGLVLYNYAGNAPKYLVDWYLTDGLQAVCGYMMMPMFVLSILIFLVLQPAVKGLGDTWNTDMVRFRQKVIRHILAITGLAAAVIGAGILTGIPVLSGLYRTDLQPYRMQFLILMTGGAVCAASSYLITLLTTMRRQNGIIWGCGAAVSVYLALGGVMSRKAGFTGTCWLYVIGNLVMAGVFLLFLRRRESRDENPDGSGENEEAHPGEQMDPEKPDRPQDPAVSAADDAGAAGCVCGE